MQLPEVTTDHDVAVVGAGPAGLVAATVLARQGVDVLLIEKRSRTSDLPRAVGITIRQMELFRSWGLEQQLRTGADDVELAVLETVTASDAGRGTPRDMNVPNRSQSKVVSPTASARVPQDHLEAVLIEHLASLPSATIRLSAEVTDVTQTEHAVRLGVRSASTGAPNAVSAGFVVAADGARSPLREAMGIEMVGPDDMMSGLAVEFRAPLWPVLGDHRYALYTITHPEGGGVLIPAGQGDRWQFGVVLREGDDLTALGMHEALRHRIRSAAGVPDLPVDIVRVHPFSSGAQLAERFSAGRVFLVGDAAHRVTPRGGNGLAMAVRDGIELGWRMAWVVRGWAPLTFLSTYEAECRPVVADGVARAVDPDGGCRTVISEMQQDLGGRVQHAWVGPDTSTLDLVGPGLTLMAADPEDAWLAAADEFNGGGSVPIAVASLPSLTARALGLHGPGSAVLVRPDGVPVASWWAPRDRVLDLERAVEAVLRPSPTVQVRPARRSELSSVTALVSAAYACDEAAMGAELWGVYSADIHPTAETISATLVAEPEGEVVGAARYSPPDPENLSIPADVALVRALAVRPDLEGRGIARELMKECHRRATADQATVLLLHTVPFMKRAIELYVGLGFTRAPGHDIRPDEHFPMSAPAAIVAEAYTLTLATPAEHLANA